MPQPPSCSRCSPPSAHSRKPSAEEEKGEPGPTTRRWTPPLPPAPARPCPGHPTPAAGVAAQVASNRSELAGGKAWRQGAGAGAGMSSHGAWRSSRARGRCAPGSGRYGGQRLSPVGAALGLAGSGPGLLPGAPASPATTAGKEGSRRQGQRVSAAPSLLRPRPSQPHPKTAGPQTPSAASPSSLRSSVPKS